MQAGYGSQRSGARVYARRLLPSHPTLAPVFWKRPIEEREGAFVTLHRERPVSFHAELDPRMPSWSGLLGLSRVSPGTARVSPAAASADRDGRTLAEPETDRNFQHDPYRRAVSAVAGSEAPSAHRLDGGLVEHRHRSTVGFL